MSACVNVSLCVCLCVDTV